MLYLIGESSTSSITTIHKSHINAFIKDILNAFNFSWNLKKDSSTGTLSAGTFTLPSDFNPIWGVIDARIENSSTSDDNVFTLIDIRDQDLYGESDYVYWITQTPAGTFVFNTKTQSGTVVFYYHWIPTDLSADGDICVIPDGEAVAYGAAAKNWIGDERNQALKTDYEKEASARIQRMYVQEQAFGPQLREGSIIDYNSDIRGV